MQADVEGGSAMQGRTTSSARESRHDARARTTYLRLVREVAASTGASAEEAEQYLVAVIATLEEKLPLTEAIDLEAQLPSLLDEMLEREPIDDLPGMDKELFCERVALRLGITAQEAEWIAQRVLPVVSTHVSAGEARHVEAQLPLDLRRMWSGTIH
jgi:uncharacterized protein (DUF2267 family)